MKHLLSWARSLFGKEKAAPQNHVKSAVPRVRPRPAPSPATPKPQNKVRRPYAGEIGGRIADGGPGKNILVRNKYVREDTGTHETLKILDEALMEGEEEAGADPYNTGRFDRSKSWDSSRFRK